MSDFEDQYMKVLALLFLCNIMRKAMHENIDQVLMDEGISPDPAFIETLREYNQQKRFIDLDSSGVIHVNDALMSDASFKSKRGALH